MMYIYVIIINIFAFIIYGCDKLLAIKRLWRISEYNLLIMSLFGGAFGALMAMFIFHHKTHKAKFLIVNFMAIIMWVIVLNF